MPRRTAAEFAREAPSDGPYELEVGTGKSKRWIAPKPYSDITSPQRLELARINDAWAAAAGTVAMVPPMAVPDQVDDSGKVVRAGVREMTPDLYVLRFRFDALQQREPTADDPRAFIPKERAPDFDAFFKEWYSALPTSQWSKALDECDRHYDPAPGTDAEKAAAAGAAILQQCQTLLAGGDVDDPKVKELLAQIESVAEKAGAAAGKSISGGGA